jgi:hypothetical protein
MTTMTTSIRAGKTIHNPVTGEEIRFLRELEPVYVS